MITTQHANGSYTVSPEPGVEIVCRDGFVARCVSLIADENYPDARWAAAVLNQFGKQIPHEAERLS